MTPNTHPIQPVVTKHFVEFRSPGTFVSETSVHEIASWDVDTATEMAGSIKERHGATPYGFRFITRSRGPTDLDSSVSASSPFYWLGGDIRTYEQVIADDLPDERTLRANMLNNRIARIITNCNSWKFTSELGEKDIVLPWPAGRSLLSQTEGEAP